MATTDTKTVPHEKVESISPPASTGDDHVAIKTDTYAIDEDALGQNLPKHYYRSVGFIGTVIVSDSVLLACLS